MKREGFYSIGEFAVLCNTTKDTLHHYNQIGILKPAGIAENGYRLYTIREFFLFNVIRAFRANGCSLDEIHSFLDTGDTTLYIQHLEQHKQDFIKKQKDTDQTIDMLDHCIRFLKRSVSLPSNVPIVTIETDQFYLYATPCPNPVRPKSEEYKDLLFHHLVALSTISTAIKYPVGGIISKKSFDEGNYGLSYFVSRSTKPLDGSHSKVLPAGKYLAYLYESDSDDLENAYQTLQAYISQHSLTVCGDIFEFGLLDDFSTQKQNHNITHIRIPIL